MVLAQGMLGYGLTSVVGAIPAEIFQGRHYGTIFGTLIMMLTISWELALVAVVSVPVTIVVMQRIAKRSKGRFVQQWKHTGILNGQIEETFTGHTVMKAFGRQREVQAQFDATNAELHEAGFHAQFISGCIQPATTLFLRPRKRSKSPQELWFII